MTTVYERLGIAVVMMAASGFSAAGPSEPDLVRRIEQGESVECKYLVDMNKTFGWAISREKAWKSIATDTAKIGGDSFVVKSEQEKPLSITVSVYSCEGDGELRSLYDMPVLIDPPTPEFVNVDAADVPKSQVAAVIGSHVCVEGNTRPGGATIEKVDNQRLVGRWKGAIVRGNQARILTVRYVGTDGRSSGAVKINLYMKSGGRYRIDAFADASKNFMAPTVYFWVVEVNENVIVAGDLPDARRKQIELQMTTEAEYQRRGQVQPRPDSDRTTPNFFSTLLNSL